MQQTIDKVLRYNGYHAAVDGGLGRLIAEAIGDQWPSHTKTLEGIVHEVLLYKGFNSAIRMNLDTAIALAIVRNHDI